ncbi:NAD(P)-binding protein [Acephala macrosclerotiorum]|nr:NAD(P)-binding protein [Acephala macrosclerotiorum]
MEERPVLTTEESSVTAPQPVLVEAGGAVVERQDEVPPPSFPVLGSVMIIGGCGFIGSHLVATLLSDPECGYISVVSRRPSHSRHQGASYFQGDISNETRMRELLFKIQPRVIFHLASPRPEASTEELKRTNIQGTEVLLRCAARLPFVRALVYTSSAEALGFVPAKTPLAEKDSKLLTAKSRGYSWFQKSKAIADANVLEANGLTLRTACLRIPSVYGEGDPFVIPEVLKMMRVGKHTMQIGKNEVLLEQVWVGNVVRAHVLCAKALLQHRDVSASSPISGEGAEQHNREKVVHTRDGEQGKADGEAFNITDGTPLPFYTFARKIWYYAGDRTGPADIRHVSMWLVVITAWLNVVFYFVFTLGMKEPEVGPRDAINLEKGRWLSIEKARRVLGFVPDVGGAEEGLRRGVEGELYNEEMKRLVARGVPEP